jgi:hypothetical protein
LPLPERNQNKTWKLGISLDGCVPEVFDCKDIVSWSIDIFIQNQRGIILHNKSYIYLAPSTFKKMLESPELTVKFKGDEARIFLKENNNGLEILEEYLEDPSTITEDISKI